MSAPIPIIDTARVWAAARDLQVAELHPTDPDTPVPTEADLRHFTAWVLEFAEAQRSAGCTDVDRLADALGKALDLPLDQRSEWPEHLWRELGWAWW
ncbi:MAG TPA: hypothetical protein VM869_35855 [Enhygromyxa sp.]|nr:hypothetical protein [Enhygromyxa sp.]